MDRGRGRRLRQLVERGGRRYRSDGLLTVLRMAPRFILFRILLDESTRFRWRTALRHRAHRVRFDAPASPWKRVWIDPNSLDTANYELSQYIGLGLVRSGEWDAPAKNVPLDAYWSVQGIRERFRQGMDWEDTRYHREARTHIQERGSFWGYDDLEAFRRERCEYVDELYEEMKRQGYRPNTDADHEVPETAFKQKPHQHLEVLVTIGRSGEILFRDGHHRVALAQLLDVEEIPVHVLGRHRDWQRTRDAVSTVASPAELDDVGANLAHPDLQDVLPESFDDDPGDHHRPEP